MLKLSTKGRYGLRAMLELARAYNDGPVMMSIITKRQGFSRKYLHSLLTQLKQAKLVESVLGEKGRYKLTRRPTQIRVSDIFEALEGKLSVADCVTDSKACKRVKECETREMWTKLNTAMVDVLSNVTLADLLGDDAPRMYDTCIPRVIKKKEQ